MCIVFLHTMARVKYRESNFLRKRIIAHKSAQRKRMRALKIGEMGKMDKHRKIEKNGNFKDLFDDSCFSDESSKSSVCNNNASNTDDENEVTVNPQKIEKVFIKDISSYLSNARIPVPKSMSRKWKRTSTSASSSDSKYHNNQKFHTKHKFFENQKNCVRHSMTLRKNATLYKSAERRSVRSSKAKEIDEMKEISKLRKKKNNLNAQYIFDDSCFSDESSKSSICDSNGSSDTDDEPEVTDNPQKVEKVFIKDTSSYLSNARIPVPKSMSSKWKRTNISISSSDSEYHNNQKFRTKHKFFENQKNCFGHSMTLRKSATLYKSAERRRSVRISKAKEIDEMKEMSKLRKQKNTLKSLDKFDSRCFLDESSRSNMFASTSDRADELAKTDTLSEGEELLNQDTSLCSGKDLILNPESLRSRYKRIVLSSDSECANNTKHHTKNVFFRNQRNNFILSSKHTEKHDHINTESIKQRGNNSHDYILEEASSYENNIFSSYFLKKNKSPRKIQCDSVSNEFDDICDLESSHNNCDNKRGKLALKNVTNMPDLKIATSGMGNVFVGGSEICFDESVIDTTVLPFSEHCFDEHEDKEPVDFGRLKICMQLPGEGTVFVPVDQIKLILNISPAVLVEDVPSPFIPPTS